MLNDEQEHFRDSKDTGIREIEDRLARLERRMDNIHALMFTQVSSAREMEELAGRCLEVALAGELLKGGEVRP